MDSVPRNVDDQIQEFLEADVDEHEREQSAGLLLQHWHVVRDALRACAEVHGLDGLECGGEVDSGVGKVRTTIALIVTPD